MTVAAGRRARGQPAHWRAVYSHPLMAYTGTETATPSIMKSMYPDHTADDRTELWSDLVDLTGLHLDQVEGLPHTALAGSLRRILQEREQQPSSYQQYESYI